MSCQPGHPNDGPSVRPVHYYYEYGNEVKATNTSSCLLNEHTDTHTHSRFAYNSLTTTATTTTNRKPNAIASHWRSVFGSIDVWMNGIFVFKCYNNNMLWYMLSWPSFASDNYQNQTMEGGVVSLLPPPSLSTHPPLQRAAEFRNG